MIKDLNKRFKKFNGNQITDVISYIRNYVKQYPDVTIALGCDSIKGCGKTIYAFTIMFYSYTRKNGAHIIYFKEKLPKIKNDFERLGKESEFIHGIAEWLDTELSKFYIRQDLSELERKRYKFHLSKCNGEFTHVGYSNEELIIDNLTLTEQDKLKEFKTIDLHLDYNPSEGKRDSRGFSKNK